MSTELLYVVAGLMVLLGLAGILLPALPGVPLMFAGMLLAAWAGGFAKISVLTIVLLGILTAIAVIADLLATLFGAKKFGASKTAIFGAGIGAVVGLFFGPVGLLVGPFLGALVGEMLSGSHWQQATQAGFGATLGFLLGTLAKIAISFAMLGLFVFALLF